MHTTARYSWWSTALALLPGLLYEGLVRLRNGSYDTGFLARRRLPHPVVSIGNMTMGGSGKTPLAIHTAQMISRMGRTPVLLSRGYGRSSKGPLIVPPREPLDAPAQDIGDEPALVRRHVPEIWLGVGPDRYATGLRIERRVSNPVFILDDGFQHRGLWRNLDIVILDQSQPLMRNRVLPRGTLREPPSGLQRADIVVIHGARRGPREAAEEESIRRLNPAAGILHCIQKIDRLIEFDRWRKGGADAAPSSIPHAFLAAAIGNPDRFHRDVEQFGIEVKGARFFRDHFRLRPADWRTCADAARRSGAAAILTTEKDAIKAVYDLDFPLLVAIQSLRLAEEPQMERRLQSIIEVER